MEELERRIKEASDELDRIYNQVLNEGMHLQLWKQYYNAISNLSKLMTQRGKPLTPKPQDTNTDDSETV